MVITHPTRGKPVSVQLVQTYDLGIYRQVRELLKENASSDQINECIDQAPQDTDYEQVNCQLAEALVAIMNPDKDSATWHLGAALKLLNKQVHEQDAQDIPKEALLEQQREYIWLLAVHNAITKSALGYLMTIGISQCEVSSGFSPARRQHARQPGADNEELRQLALVA